MGGGGFSAVGWRTNDCLRHTWIPPVNGAFAGVFHPLLILLSCYSLFFVSLSLKYSTAIVHWFAAAATNCTQLVATVFYIAVCHSRPPEPSCVSVRPENCLRA